MSEYQYYEFQAIDRPLTKDEMAELRGLSTRATITSTRFQNVYHFGDFRGDPHVLMERYFDAFDYVANWGTHQFMLRLPRQILDPETASRYATAEMAEVRVKGDHVILEFISRDEDGGEWEEGEVWLPSLLPLRADLAGGDLRSLYLGWLAGAEAGLLDDEDIEPPVPPGLGRLSAPLKSFAEFLRLDEDLLAVAASQSSDLQSAEPSRRELERWIAALPAPEKDALLLRAATGEAPQLGAELLRRFRQATAPPSSTLEAAGRTVGELLSAAEARTEARERAEAEREAQERARRERERAAYLADLATRQEETWREIEALAETKQPASYDEAARLVADLREVSARRDDRQPHPAAA
jgi:hypothetical protein